MRHIDVHGRLSVYLRGGGVIDLPKGHAVVSIGNSGNIEELTLTNDGTVELLFLDTKEVAAIVKERPSDSGFVR